MSKFIFVTGDYVSKIGKGTAAAALAKLLSSRGLKVNVQKIDTYLNLDSGTMSPYQHGEVFVTEDGSETDINVGVFERFLNVNLSGKNDISLGKIFTSVINKERQGKYVGATVQIIPTVTTEIKDNFLSLQNDETDVVIVVVGGTVSELEQNIVLQAIKQLQSEVGEKNVFIAHLADAPYFDNTKELKIEAVQPSVKAMNGFGLMPDAVVVRLAKGLSLGADNKKRIVKRCFVKNEKYVISLPNVDSIYEIPVMLQKEGLDEVILNKFGLNLPAADLSAWKQMLSNSNGDYQEVKFCIVGKYTKVPDAYISICEAISHACNLNSIKPTIEIIDAEDIEELGAEKYLHGAKAIIVPPGWGSRGFKGMTYAIKYARENKIPYLGIGFGMQLAVIEFARNVLNYDANSTEINAKTEYPVVDIMEEQKKFALNGKTMRLGKFDIVLDPDSVSAKLYGTENISERHRNRYEFNSKYYEDFEKRGMSFAGKNPETELVEIIELKDHPFFVASIFQPELKSRPNKPHPLFLGLVNAAKSIR